MPEEPFAVTIHLTLQKTFDSKNDLLKFSSDVADWISVGETEIGVKVVSRVEINGLSVTLSP